jgi:parvulin-like peptidyl-prolyl isomerase
MRRFKIVVGLLLVFVIISGLVGCGKKIAAVVNGKNIYAEDVDKQLEGIKGQHGDVFKGAEGKKKEKEFKLKIIDNLVSEQLILEEAEKRKIKVSNDEYALKLAEIKKSFPSEEKFNEALKKEGLTEKSLEEIMKKQILIQKVSDKITAGIEIPESEIKDYYDKNLDLFKEPEQVKARHILVKTEKEANDILSKLKTGSSFEELAKQYSTDKTNKDQGGDLGWISKGQMAPEFENAAFSLEKGKLSDPVKTQYGFHIIRIDDKKAAEQKSFDTVKVQVAQTLKTQKQREKFQIWVEGVKKKSKIEIKI